MGCWSTNHRSEVFLIDDHICPTAMNASSTAAPTQLIHNSAPAERSYHLWVPYHFKGLGKTQNHILHQKMMKYSTHAEIHEFSNAQCVCRKEILKMISLQMHWYPAVGKKEPCTSVENCSMAISPYLQNFWGFGLTLCASPPQKKIRG